MQKPETKIVNAIQSWVEAEDGLVLKLHGSAMQRVGEPDLIGWVSVINNLGNPDTVHFAVEVKQPGEQPRRIQEYRMEQWALGGFCTGSVTSLDEFQELLYAWVERWL